MNHQSPPEFADIEVALRRWTGRKVVIQLEARASGDSVIAVIPGATVDSVGVVSDEDSQHPGRTVAVALSDARGESVASVLVPEELVHVAPLITDDEVTACLAGVHLRITTDDDPATSEYSLASQGRDDGLFSPHPSDYSGWTAEQRRQAVELVESRTWGDVGGAIRSLEAALRLAMEATRSDFDRWEDCGDDEGLPDEYSLSPEQVAGLSEQWRLAYVARLLRSIALMYGFPTEFDSDQEPGLMTRLLFGSERASISELLHGLNDISVGIYR